MDLIILINYIRKDLLIVIHQVIILDEEKILRENTYDLQSMWNTIDALFVQYGLVKTGKGQYEENVNSSRDGTVDMMMTVFILSKTQWFMENLKEWFSFEDDEYIDLKNHYLEKKKWLLSVRQ